MLAMLLVGSCGFVHAGVVPAQSVEIKWSPRVGQEWTYECESGAPSAATDWFYYDQQNTLKVRIEAVTDDAVTIKFTNQFITSGIEGMRLDGREPVTEFRQYNRKGEPIGDIDFFPTRRARNGFYGSYSGFTYPNGPCSVGSSWGAVVNDSSRTPRELRDVGHLIVYTGTVISTFVGIEKVGEVECWKIAYRSLGLDGGQIKENSGTAWLDTRDGSIVRVKEGERPAVFKNLGQETLKKMSGYCKMRLVAMIVNDQSAGWWSRIAAG